MRKDAGSDVAKSHTPIIIGPWNHTVPALQKTKFGDVDFGPSAGVDFESGISPIF